MLSLAESLEILEEDITSDPMRISAYHDLPFAIFRYDPWSEYELRNRLRLLSASLKSNHGRVVKFVSLAALVWETVKEVVGVDSLAQLEKDRGFEIAQQTINRVISDADYRPLWSDLVDRFSNMQSERDIVFLVRAGVFAPAIYRSASLLDELHRKTLVPVILFYPGTMDGTTLLRFMNLPDRGNSPSNYRVKIYGGD